MPPIRILKLVLWFFTWAFISNFMIISCKDNAAEKNVPPNERFVAEDEFTKNSIDSVVSGDLSGTVEEKPWKLRSGAVSLLEESDFYSGIIGGTKGGTQAIVCDSKGNANFRVAGQFKNEGLIEVNLPAKVGSYSSTGKNKDYSVKIYGKEEATSWDVKINKISKAELSGSLKAVFGKSDSKQKIEGDFTVEICSKK